MQAHINTQSHASTHKHTNKGGCLLMILTCVYVPCSNEDSGLFIDEMPMSDGTTEMAGYKPMLRTYSVRVLACSCLCVCLCAYVCFCLCVCACVLLCACAAFIWTLAPLVLVPVCACVCSSVLVCVCLHACAPWLTFVCFSSLQPDRVLPHFGTFVSLALIIVIIYIFLIINLRYYYRFLFLILSLFCF